MRHSIVSLALISTVLLLSGCATTEGPRTPRLGAELPTPDVLPVVISQELPKYPEQPNFAGVQLDLREAEVEVYFIIETDGTVREAQTDESSVYGRAALEAVRKWRFHPGTIAGVPVRTPTKVVIKFSEEPPTKGYTLHYYLGRQVPR